MPAERAGYTVTMFLVDVSPSMGEIRTVELPPGPKGEQRTRQVTRLGWVLEFVMLKIQEMIFHGRKTDQCGVILCGTRETNNIVNKQNDGYEHVSEFIPIGQPNAQTMSKVKSIRPSTIIGDPIDAVIVGIETQARYLSKKPTWTRKMVLLTDGENPMEIEDWEATVNKINELNIETSIIGVDFDDQYMPFYEKNKSPMKRANEAFYAKFARGIRSCIMGTAALALQECSKPEIKVTKSTLMASKLRIGDTETRPEEAIEIQIKTSKCTALSRPPSMKKFVKRGNDIDAMETDEEDNEIYALLSSKSRYVVERFDENPEDKMDEDDEYHEEVVEKEELIRGYKYGASFVPLESEDDFERLEPKTGIDICGFFYSKNFRRDWSMGEVQYVWADPTSPREQVAFSSIVQAMFEKQAMAIARLVGKGDPKMGVLMPRMLENVDCFLWVQVPFADDLRKFTYRSLDKLVSKKGKSVVKHPYFPTQEQMEAMDRFVDGMDLMHAGEKDEQGNRLPWFDPVQAYNPAVHRLKQALFHGAITSDLSQSPLPPPNPELIKYFNTPDEVLQKAREAIESCKSAFKVKQAPAKVVKRRKDGHIEGEDEDEGLIDLGAPIPREKPLKPANISPNKKVIVHEDSGTEEDSADEVLPVKKSPSVPARFMNKVGERAPPTPAASVRSQATPNMLTPARSLSPLPVPGKAPGRIIGNVSPLVDFKNVTEEGDVVSQAVRELGEVIREVIMKPLASRRHEEMVACMKEMRNIALQEDEIAEWNSFLRGLKDACLTQTPNNTEFWKEIQLIGRPISLISSKEARKFGGKSDVTEGTAVDFVEEEDG